jgi:hypothetical protein
MPAATSILDTRDAVATIAADVGVEVPDSLRTAYETAARDLADARTIADAQLATITALDDAADAVAAERDLFVSVGLLGETPEAALDAATVAFETDDMVGATSTSEALSGLLDGATEVGRTRVLAAGGATLVVVLLAGGGLLVLRRRRAAASVLPASLSPAIAGGTGRIEEPGTSDEPGPYATLADPEPLAAPTDDDRSIAP